MAVDRTWRSVDRRWLVDQVVDEPGIEFRVWDSEGAPIADAAGTGELYEVLDELGADLNTFERVPTDDPWCE